MEVVQIVNEAQHPWGGFISLDNDQDGHQVFLSPVENQPVTPQYYFVDTDGSILPILDGDKIAFLAPEPDDEIP